MDSLIDLYIDKLRKYAEKIGTRSLCHASVPVWRSRALGAATYLHSEFGLRELGEEQLNTIIKIMDKYLCSFNNSTGGYYERWLEMTKKFEQRLEYLKTTRRRTIPKNDTAVQKLAFTFMGSHLAVHLEREQVPDLIRGLSEWLAETDTDAHAILNLPALACDKVLVNSCYCEKR